MSKIQPIPKEIVQLVPPFNGDSKTLSLFLRKCEYVYDQYKGTEEQNCYVFNVLTCRLIDDAAALLSEREDILTWPALKELLIEHFGDPRDETSIYFELESLRIKPDESYHAFCNRIKSVKSLLISKVNRIESPELKRAKLEVYNNSALNVFLYNLPENIVHIVRLKAPKTLEAALTIVLEEVNFLEQYYMRNGILNKNQFGYKYIPPNIPKFNVPHNLQNWMPHMANQQQQQQQNSTAFRPFGTLNQQSSSPLFGSKPIQPSASNKPGQSVFGSQPQSTIFGGTSFGSAPLGSAPQGFTNSTFGTASQTFGSSSGFKPPQEQKSQAQVNAFTSKAQSEQQGPKLNKLTVSGSGDDCKGSYYYDNDYGNILHQSNFESNNELSDKSAMANDCQMDFRDRASIDKKT